MKKKIYSIIAIASFSAMVISGCQNEGEDSEKNTDSVAEIEQVQGDSSEKKETRIFDIGEEAPDFKLESLDREVYRLEELRGKPVLLNFFGVNCPYCIEGMPDLNRLYQENKDSAAVLLINGGEPREAVERIRDEHSLKMPVLMDMGFVSRDYMAQYVPYTVVIDGEGLISAIKVGPMSYEEMQTQLDMASGK